MTTMTTVRARNEAPPVSARLRGLAPVLHGGLSLEELVRQGLDPTDVFDLSSNVSPYGPPPSIAEALREVTVDRYPEPTARAMREAIAAQLGLAPDAVVAGNGSVELIYLLAQVYLDPGARALVLGPTFGEYAAATRFAGAEVVEYRARPEQGFRPDLAAILALIRAHRPRLVFLCNPNNPTGQVLGEAALRALLDETAAHGGLLVLDEAYRALADDDVLAWDSLELRRRGPVVFLRSLTKDYAVPGLRLGYAVAPEAAGRALNALRVPWSVNVFAEAVGRRLLDETAYLAAMRARLARDKAYLRARLDEIDACHLPSAANYCLIRVGHGKGAARDCRRALLRHGVIVRDCASFGLPAHIRVCVNERAATDRLVGGLREWSVVGGRWSVYGPRIAG